MRRQRAVAAGATGILVLTLAAAGATAAGATEDCVAPLTGFRAHGATIGIVTDESIAPAVVEEAIAIWRECANFGGGFPELRAGDNGTRTVYVRFLSRSRGTTCGFWAGRLITLYDYYTDAQGEPQRCSGRGRASLGRNLAHELGHVLGLDDAPSGTRCAEHVMAPVTTVNAGRRRVQVAECSLAGQKWITPEEEPRLAELGASEAYVFAAARLNQ